jgi:nucleotide-binding universal stress UspA family protein
VNDKLQTSFPPLRILVPIDGSENGTRALEAGIELAKVFAAELIVLNVIPAPSVMVEISISAGFPPDDLHDYYQRQDRDSNNFIEGAMELVKRKGVFKARSEIVRAQKSIVEEIIEKAANERTDLIVIGTRGLGGFKKLLLGSVSSGVVTHSHCNTFVVR